MRELYYQDLARLQMVIDRIQQSRFLMFALLWMLIIVGFFWAQDSLAAATGGAAGGAGGAAAPASTVGNDAFSAFYDFVYSAATGNLGRGIALTGGIIGLGFGAASGRALPAVVGIVLAMFGALGPSIINALFETAII